MSDYKIPAGWLRAVDEALVAAHIGIASESDDYDTAKRKLNALIDWHVAVATDPDVNGGRKLVPVEPAPPVQPFGYLRQTSSDRNPPHGWALHFFKRAGDVAVYLDPTLPKLRMPEPMADNELVEIYRALPKNSPIVRDGSTTIRLGRAVEAETLKRVKEANK